MPSTRTRSALATGFVALVPLLLAAQQPATKPAMDKMSMVKAMGSFRGAEGHQSAGTYTIEEVGGKFVLAVSEDFSVDRGAPDAYVVLSSGAKVGKDKAVWLGKIKSYTGAQTFEIPAGAKLDGLTTVVLWCRRYSATIGTAGFDPAGLVHDTMDKIKNPKP